MLCQSSLLSTIISFVYKDKLCFYESISVIFFMENTCFKPVDDVKYEGQVRSGQVTAFVVCAVF